MNESKQLTFEDIPKMTIKEVAMALNVTTRTITRYVEKYFTGIMIHGRVTTLSELQVTKIKLELEKAKNLDTSAQLPKTELEKELIIQQAMQFQLEKIGKLQLQLENQKQVIEYQRPMVESFLTFIDSEGLSDMSQVAKLLGTGRTRLFMLLRDNKILMYNNLPYQRFIDSGHFEIKKTVKNDRNYSVTLATTKGINYIRNRFEL